MGQKRSVKKQAEALAKMETRERYRWSQSLRLKLSYLQRAHNAVLIALIDCIEYGVFLIYAHTFGDGLRGYELGGWRRGFEFSWKDSDGEDFPQVWHA